MSSTLEQAEKLIPADVRMISGCRDSQTSADVSNVANFSLPDPHGRAGGALTSALLKVCYEDGKTPDDVLSFQEVLLKIRDVLSTSKFTQVPQLTSSRPTDIKQPFTIIPEGFKGTRRALLIGINYTGQNGELRGCQADVFNMVKYIKAVHGFTDSDITLLLDDGSHTAPTKDNICAAYAKLAADAKAGDAVFCHYSGHGAKIADDSGDEEDGFDETLVPVDYEKAGMIRDDDLFKTLVGPMAKGVVMTCIYDCCHSGTVLDLPYRFIADGESDEIEAVPGYDFGSLEGLWKAYQAWRSGDKIGVAMALGQELLQKGPKGVFGGLFGK